MTELALTLLRLGYLALLWIFVLAVMAVLRRDIFGTRIANRPAGARARRGRGEPRAQRPAAPPATRRRLGRLVVTAGPLSGTTLPLGGSSIVVGRSPACTLVLEDDYASGRHARFYSRDDTWWVEDLGSTNGTLVADQRLTAPVALSEGVGVRIGRTVIELRR